VAPVRRIESFLKATLLVSIRPLPSLSVPFLINGESSIRPRDEGAFLQIPEESVNSKNEAMGFLKI
jgi:hypothetical protein